MIHSIKVLHSSVIPSGSACTNPEISVAAPIGVTVVCLNDDSVEIQINDQIAGPYCLTYILKCSTECQVCPDVVVQKCFCIDSDDCSNCSYCDNYICISRCKPGEVCVNNTCSTCGPDKPCLCNKICSQGGCICPPDKPIERIDGCCVQCIEGVTPLGPCEVCEDGMIKPKICPGGVCNPETNNCQSCLTKDDCLGPNECCIGGQCKCCTGYIRNPISGLCEPAPPCIGEEECVLLYGPCFTCGINGCEPKKCPIGQTCVNGDCVQTCSDTVPCPPGSGCLNGGCVPCDQLSCFPGDGPQCAFALGCRCSSTNVCEGVDCSLTGVSAQWLITEDIPGQPLPNTGLPKLQGTANIVPLGLVYLQPPSGSAYYNHRFDLAITNGNSGTWIRKNNPNESVLLGSGTSVSFDLASTGPNLVGFIVEFTEQGTGRKATWAISRNIFAPLTDPNVWSYEFYSTGTPPSYSGGTPGSVKLCTTNGNFQPVGVVDVVTTGTLVISFSQDPTNPGCLIAYIQGCGTWNGNLQVKCGGNLLTIPVPEFYKDPANCCSPTDPNCGGWGTGDPCTTVTVQNIDLVVLPTYGNGAGGDGEFMAVADWQSAGISFLDLFYLNPAPGCWTVANNPASQSNDIAIVTGTGQSPFGPSVSALSAFFTFGDGGCIRFGHACELRISGCKKLQGEKCMTECSQFSVDIVMTGPNTYTAVPSMVDEVVTYQWQYPGLLNTTSQTVTITPQGGNTNLLVTAFYGTAPVKCTAVDSLLLSTTIPGCTNSAACNYNSAANVDDGTCIFIEAGTYDCVLGYQPGLQSIVNPEVAPNVVHKIGATTITTNSKIDPGSYTVDIYVDGVLKCSRPITVPQCYRCDMSSNCIPAPVGNNQGMYTTSNCDNKCSCNIEINIQARACTNGQGAMYITATGDTGTYQVSVTNVGTGSQIMAPTYYTSGGVGITTPQVCPGIYRVTVQGNNCTRSRDYQILCDTCSGTSLDLVDIVHECALTQLTYTIVGAPCSSTYNVQLLSNSMQPLTPAFSVNYTTVGTKSEIIGVRDPGNYYLKLTDNNGCSIVRPVVICEDELGPCSIETVSLDYTVTSSGTMLTFTANIFLNASDGIYDVKLYQVGPGTCPGTYVPTGSPLGTAFIGGLGPHVVNFTDVVPLPGVDTCFAVYVEKRNNNACNQVTLKQYVVGSAPPPPCSGVISNVSYDTLTAKPVVSWDFSNTSHSLTVQIQTGAGPSCNPGDPVVVTSTGNGEDGTNIQFGPIPQTQTPQFICVTIWDEANPTCKATATAIIPACSCGVEILSWEVHPEVPELEVTYRVKCSSALVDLDVTGDATGTLTNQAATSNGLWVEYTKTIPLVGYPSPGGTITLQILDNVSGLCQDSEEIVLPPNCSSCSQVVSLYLNDSEVTAVKNFAGVNVVSGSYQLPAAAATLGTDMYTELVSDGANFCNGASDISVGASRDAGMIVAQDSSNYESLDHALISHPTDWVGSKKTYFGNCGCGITRKCDYEAQLPISGTADQIVFTFATNNAAADYTGKVEIEIDVPQTFSPTDRAAIEAAILGALTGAACGYDVDAVTVTYDDGTDVLTVLIEQTNAGIGLIKTLQLGSVGAVVDFTQSNCA